MNAPEDPTTRAPSSIPLPPPTFSLPPTQYGLEPGLETHQHVARTLAAGQLTPGWRTLFIAGWIGVLLGFAAVWQASRIAGTAPWWLGPETDQRSFAIIALPFAAPVAAVIAGITRLRTACLIGIAAALSTGGIALGEVDRFPGIATVEFALAAAGLLISVAALGGRMRRPDSSPISAMEPSDRSFGSNN